MRLVSSFMSEPQPELSLEQRIMAGLDALDISYGEEAINNLVVYLDVLQEWNKTHT